MSGVRYDATVAAETEKPSAATSPSAGQKNVIRASSNGRVMSIRSRFLLAPRR